MITQKANITIAVSVLRCASKFYNTIVHHCLGSYKSTAIYVLINRIKIDVVHTCRMEVQKKFQWPAATEGYSHFLVHLIIILTFVLECDKAQLRVFRHHTHRQDETMLILPI